MIEIIKELKQMLPQYEKEISLISSRLSILPKTVSDEIAMNLHKIIHGMKGNWMTTKADEKTSSMMHMEGHGKLSDLYEQKMHEMGKIVGYKIESKDDLYEAIYKIMVAGNEMDKTNGFILATQLIVLDEFIATGHDK